MFVAVDNPRTRTAAIRVSARKLSVAVLLSHIRRPRISLLPFWLLEDLDQKYVRKHRYLHRVSGLFCHPTSGTRWHVLCS